MCITVSKRDHALGEAAFSLRILATSRLEFNGLPEGWQPRVRLSLGTLGEAHLGRLRHGHGCV